jgi:hypothetical protein
MEVASKYSKEKNPLVMISYPFYLSHLRNCSVKRRWKRKDPEAMPKKEKEGNREE